MAAKYKNGAVLVQLESLHPNSREVYAFHANGHVLVKRWKGDTWHQWAIIPVDGMGSLVDHMLANGCVEK